AITITFISLAGLFFFLTFRHLAAIAETKHLYSRLEKANEELFNISRADSLTGLLNRRALSEGMTKLLAQSKRSGHEVSVIILDIDRFKSYNDRFGHIVGDQVLRRLAAIMYNTIRDVDIAARYGGEEFCVVLPSTNGEGAVHVAEKLRITCDSIEGDHHFTFSAGVATWDGIENVESLIQRADGALYIAKESGRNRTILIPNPQHLPSNLLLNT
ncbi:MAG: GGDEF domain-containing protein, partial [Acidimicrobiales bacterium]|nr:GGDEF domain-containing protein [Acidimicrobiales bacterium]